MRHLPHWTDRGRAAPEDIAFVVSSGRKQHWGDARDTLAQEITDNPDRVKGALAARTEDRHQDLLRMCRCRVRLPPQILRLTIAGRSACSARQLLASMDGSCKKLNSADHSRSR